jgi:hypothetical protein
MIDHDDDMQLFEEFGTLSNSNSCISFKICKQHKNLSLEIKLTYEIHKKELNRLAKEDKRPLSNTTFLVHPQNFRRNRSRLIPHH